MEYNALDDVLEYALVQLKECKPGTREYGQALQIVKDIEFEKMEYERHDLDIQSKEETSKLEKDIEKIKMSTEREDKEKDRKIQLIQIIATTGVSVIGLITYVALYCKSMKFEETGTFTSATFKNLMKDNTKALKVK